MAVGLLGAAVCGFMRSMPLEAPQLKTQVLDLSGAPSWALGLGGMLGVWVGFFPGWFLSELGRFEFSLELGPLGIFKSESLGLKQQEIRNWSCWLPTLTEKVPPV